MIPFNKKYFYLVFLSLCLACASSSQIKNNGNLKNQKANSSLISLDQRKHFYDLGLQSYLNGDYETALMYYQKANQGSQPYALPAYGEGLIFLKRKNFVAAEKSFSTALSVKPNFSQAYHGLGRAQRELGQYQNARKAYLTALKYNPNNKEIYYNLGILHEVYLGNERDALKYYYRYVELAGSNQEVVKQWIQLIEEKLKSSRS